MALTASQLTQMHRRQLLLLREATIKEMRRLWPALSWDDLDGTYPALAAAAAEMVAKYRRTAAGLSAAYLRAHRVASGLDGNVKIELPPVLNVDQFDASLHSQSVASLKVASAKSTPADEAMLNALTRSAGAMSRLVLDASRETVSGTIRNDPRARGYQRVLGRGGCGFCRMLAGRGAVYGAETVGFDAHDRCGCSSEPVYDLSQQNAKSDWVPKKDRRPEPSRTDIDAGRTVEQLRSTLAALERSLAKFESAGTRARVEELRRKIAARS